MKRHGVESEARPEDGSQASGAATSGKSKILIFAFIAGALLFSWPTLKGIFYGYLPPAPVATEDLPPWRDSYAQALEESRQSGKPVLIDFTADWCPPCRVMEVEVWPDPSVRAALQERVIPLQLDVDERASAEVVKKYGIRVIPTVLLADGEGSVIASGNFMSASGLIAFLEQNAASPR